ncbi:Lrp/AsnC family transcriptional regulator [Billgrantia tianxiuensis]|uniref:Lrp/AsnC family transcriptional regulator n=1 Tax=Billgrantia tianxiuensis TaxID=2497861 RepID=UPI001F2A5966|nr:Lrp/AsnC family transcriptional regulator [Halomonas tianxiuensis]
MATKLDRIDRRILNQLQENGRLSIVELASRVNLTKTPCAQRVRRLEQAGIIRGYRADLDPEQLGRATCWWCW